MKHMSRLKRLIGIGAVAAVAVSIATVPALSAQAALGLLKVTNNCPNPYTASSWTEENSPAYVTCTVQVKNTYTDAGTVTVQWDGEQWASYTIPDNSLQTFEVLVPVSGGTHTLSAKGTISAVVQVHNYTFSIGNWANASWTPQPAVNQPASLTPTLDIAPDWDRFPLDAKFKFTISRNTDGFTDALSATDWIDDGYAVPSTLLQPNTTYYWKATAKAPAGSAQALTEVTSPVYSFTTSADTSRLVDSGDVQLSPEGDVYASTETGPTASTTPDSSINSLMTTSTLSQLPYADWRPCGAYDSADKAVHSYTRIRMRKAGYPKMEPGNATLRCGNASYGFRHIRDKHTADWSGKAAPAQEPWRDLAGWATATTLTSPDKIIYDAKRESWCYSRWIGLYNKRNGQLVSSMIVKTILGKTGQRIITSYPSGSQCTGTKLYP